MHLPIDHSPAQPPRVTGVISVFGFAEETTAALRDVFGDEYALKTYRTEAALLKAVSGPSAPRHEALPHVLLVNVPEPVTGSAPRPASAKVVREGIASAPFQVWLDLIRELEVRVPEQPIVVAADAHHHAAQIEAALSEGADEWIDINIAPSLLRFRIQTVIERWQHRQAIDRELTVNAAQAHDPVPSPAPLNPAETWMSPLTPDAADAAVARVASLASQMRAPAEIAATLVELLRVPDTDLVEPTSGRLDAKLIAKALGVSLRGLAGAMPVSPQALSASPDLASAQAALHPFARILSALRTLLPAEARKAWLHAPNPRWQDRPPVEAMLSGEAPEIARVLEMLVQGDGGL